jgi:hypothetical protein
LTLAGFLGFGADVIMGGVAQRLFAAQIPLSRLDGDVPWQDLNLLEAGPLAALTDREVTDGRGSDAVDGGAIGGMVTKTR